MFISAIKNIIRKSCNIIKKIIIIPGLFIFRAFLGTSGCCRYPITCTNYITHEFTKNQNLIITLYNSIKRLFSCCFLFPQKED